MNNKQNKQNKQIKYTLRVQRKAKYFTPIYERQKKKK